MIATLRTSLMLGAALCLATMGANTAHAQETGGESAIDALSSDIVVTATKKRDAENVQDVPLAITALGAASLDALKVRDLQSLSHISPGVSLDQVGTVRGTANFSIRGLGINSSIPSIDPTVGTFIDGVYIGINSGVVFDLFDLASVEILRGPQGILFGRNTTGGAVLINTGNPTRDWHFKAKIGADGPIDGGRGAPGMTGQALVFGPLSDSVGIKLGIYHNTDGGYFKNRFNNGNFGRASTTAFRAGLSFDLGGVTILAKGELFDSHGDGAVTQNHGLFSRKTFDLSVNNEGFYDVRAWFGSLRADYELGEGKITSIFGYRHYRQSTDNDIDSSPLTLFHSVTGLAQEQLSDELRYNGKFGALDLTFGGYIFHQEIAYEEDRKIAPNPVFYGGGKQDHDVYGLFASADVELAPTLAANLGIRWSQENKDAAITFVRPRVACSVIAGTCPVSGFNSLNLAEVNGFTDQRSWKNWTPKLGLTWTPAEHVLAYGSWTRGYRSGGYNLRITAPANFLANAVLTGSPAFDAEKVDSYEAGLKLQTGDRKGTLNLAIYQTVVGNMQREINLSSPGSGVAQSIYNTADARIRGFEAEGRYQLTDSLLVSGNFGHIAAHYTRAFYDISGDGAISAADLALALPRVPRWTWGVSALHEARLGEHSRIVTRVDFQHRSRYAYTDSNFGWVAASDNLDASLTWHLPVKGMSISLWGKNLLDEVQFGGDTQIPFGAGAYSDGNNRPFDPSPAAGTFSPLAKGRVVGVDFAVEF